MSCRNLALVDPDSDPMSDEPLDSDLPVRGVQEYLWRVTYRFGRDSVCYGSRLGYQTAVAGDRCGQPAIM